MTRMEVAAEVLRMSTEELEHALMTAWNESQLSDESYARACEKRVPSGGGHVDPEGTST